jgi:deoxycytidine triphosphate deaminase
MRSERDQGYEGSSLWIDPDKSRVCGVLLSDRISYYTKKVGLIEPFDGKHLAPASYDLTLGSECWYSDHAIETGQAKRMLELRESLIIPPNSIVFVSTAETLNLPFYLVGRFNLKLRFLHEGLLVGVGPQVDPGFAGRLSCPLHNISSEKICLTCGDPFAVIEFQKTTPFAEGENLEASIRLGDIRRLGEESGLNGIEGYKCITFPTRSLRREPVKGYLPPGKQITSSMQALVSSVSQTSAKTQSTLNDFAGRMQTLTLATVVAVAVVAISMGTYFWGAVSWSKTAYQSAVGVANDVKDLNDRLKNLKSEQTRLNNERKADEARLDELQRQVKELRKRLKLPPE